MADLTKEQFDKIKNEFESNILERIEIEKTLWSDECKFDKQDYEKYEKEQNLPMMALTYDKYRRGELYVEILDFYLKHHKEEEKKI